MPNELPTPCQLLKAREWLRAGAPAAARNFDAGEAVQILCRLIAALPAALPVYRYGTSENREAMLECDAAEDLADSKAKTVKAAVTALTHELWGDPEQPPDWTAEWSHARLQELVRNLARAAGVPVPPWAG